MPEFRTEDIKSWTAGEWLTPPPEVCTGISTDTRKVAEGNIFLALRGENFDGHAFIAQAASAGAIAAVVDAGGADSDSGGLPLLAVKDTLTALQAAGREYGRNACPLRIGVTGSAGKTTVKEMVADVLASKMKTARTTGNWNNHIGVPLSLLSVEEGTEVGVFEFGINHPGEMLPLCRLVEPQYGMITNVGPVHMEFFESVHEIAIEKAGLLTTLPADGTAILPSDDEYFSLLRDTVPCRMITVSLEPGADYSVIGAKTSADAVAVLEKSSGDEFVFRPPLPGSHMVHNALFAIATGRDNGIEWDAIRTALEGYEPLPLRWSESDIRGVTFINDAYNANPVSMRAAVSAFCDAGSGPAWLVLGGMMELGTGERDEHVSLGAFTADLNLAGLIAVGDMGTWIADGAVGNGMDTNRVYKCADAGEAVGVMAEQLKPGDRVLLKASRGVALEKVGEEYALLPV